MRISVVTISYNQVRFIRQCIDSVLGQDYEDVEYIVVDAGSTDGSRDIIRSYADRIVRVFQSDSGPPEGLNKGFACASGDIFGFINADDILLPHALRTIADSFRGMPTAEVVSGCGFLIDGDGKRLRRVVPSKFTPWLYAYGAVTVFQQGTFFKKAAYERSNGFNTANRIAWDGELFLDMVLAGAPFRRITEDVAAFRIHSSSITGGGGHSAQNHAFQEYRARIFDSIMGRSMRKSDVVVSMGARSLKLLLDPRYTMLRARGGLRRPRLGLRAGPGHLGAL